MPGSRRPKRLHQNALSRFDDAHCLPKTISNLLAEGEIDAVIGPRELATATDN
jgi:hypothetical protein